MQNRRAFFGTIAGLAAGAAVANVATASPPVKSLARKYSEAVEDANAAPETRLALMRVSNELLDTLLPAWTEKDYEECLGRERLRIVHDALLLPDDVTVVAISRHCFFAYNQTAIKMTGPEFPTREQGAFIQQVSALYRRRLDTNESEFVGWNL